MHEVAEPVDGFLSQYSSKENSPRHTSRERRTSITTTVVNGGIEVTLYDADTDGAKQIDDLNPSAGDVSNNKFVIRRAVENDKHKHMCFFEISSSASSDFDEYKEMTMRELLDQLSL